LIKGVIFFSFFFSVQRFIIIMTAHPLSSIIKPLQRASPLFVD